MLDTHPCAVAVAGCREACPTAHLMCIGHWRMVPAALQREVWAAYKRWRGAISRNRTRSKEAREQGCTEETFNAARDLRAVQQLAIEAVVEKLRKRDQLKQEGQNRIF